MCKSYKEPLICVKKHDHIQLSIQDIVTFDNMSDSYLIIYVLSGQGTVYYIDEFVGIKQHDLLFVDLNNPFYYSSNDIDVYQIEFFGVIPTQIKLPEFIYSIKNHYTFYNKLLSLSISDNENQIAILNIYTGILNELTDKENRYTVKINENPLYLAIRYMDDNFNSKINLDSISKRYGFSKYHFIRLFKNYTGLTPYQYLLNLRIEHSKYLLTHSKLKVFEIAVKSGFTSSENFIICFKKKSSSTPNSYRKQKENNNGKRDFV